MCQVERWVGVNLDVVVAVQQHGGLGVVIGPLRRSGGDHGRVVGGREVNGRAEAEAVVDRGGPQGIEAFDQQGVVAADGQRAFPVIPARIAHHLATEGVQQTPAQVAIAGAQGLEVSALACRRLEAVGGRAAAGVERAADRAAQGAGGGRRTQVQQPEGKVVSLLRRPEGDGVVAGHQVEHPGPLEAVVPAQVGVGQFGPVRAAQAPVRVVVGGGRLRVEVNRGVVRQREVEDRAAAARRQAEGLRAAQHQRRAHRQTRLRRVAVENELEAVVVRVGAEVFTRHHQGVAAGQAERQIGKVVEIPGGAHTPAERVQQHQAGAARVGGNRVHIDVVAGHRVKGIHLGHVAGVQLAADHTARSDETGGRDVEQSQAEITHGGVVAANHQGVVACDQIDPAGGVEAPVQVIAQRAVGQAGAEAVVDLALRAAQRQGERIVPGQRIQNHTARRGHREAVDCHIAGRHHGAGHGQSSPRPEAAVDHRCHQLVQRESEGGVGWHAVAAVQQHGVAPAVGQRGQLGVVVVLVAQQLPGRVIHPEVAVRMLRPGQKQFLASLTVEGESHGLATGIEGAGDRAVRSNGCGPRQVEQAHVVSAGGVTRAADVNPVVAGPQVEWRVVAVGAAQGAEVGIADHRPSRSRQVPAQVAVLGQAVERQTCGGVEVKGEVVHLAGAVHAARDPRHRQWIGRQQHALLQRLGQQGALERRGVRALAAVACRASDAGLAAQRRDDGLQNVGHGAGSSLALDGCLRVRQIGEGDSAGSWAASYLSDLGVAWRPLAAIDAGTSGNSTRH